MMPRFGVCYIIINVIIIRMSTIIIMFMIIITIIIASFNIFWSAALHQHLAGHSIRRIEFSTTFKTFQNFQDMLRSFDDDDDFMTTMMMMMM